jgi:hypothetical protein
MNAMIVVFANNQVIVAPSGTTNTIRTDPFSMNGNDRMTSVGNVHYIYNPDATGLSIQREVSNDGDEWLPSGAAVTTTTDGPIEMLGPNVLGYAFVRYVFSFGATGAAGGVCFDVHSNVDHS